jgi:hypothetical protein
MTELELKKVTQACSAVPLAEGAYAETEYLVNVFLTVLDLQMHNKLWMPRSGTIANNDGSRSRRSMT